MCFFLPVENFFFDVFEQFFFFQEQFIFPVKKVFPPILKRDIYKCQLCLPKKTLNSFLRSLFDFPNNNWKLIFFRGYNPSYIENVPTISRLLEFKCIAKSLLVFFKRVYRFLFDIN